MSVEAAVSFEIFIKFELLFDGNADVAVAVELFFSFVEFFDMPVVCCAPELDVVDETVRFCIWSDNCTKKKYINKNLSKISKKDAVYLLQKKHIKWWR